MATRRGSAVAAGGVGAAVLLALGGCSLLDDSAKTAATGGPATHGPSSSSSTGSAPTGSIEAASQLPKECSQILTTTQLQAVFGAGMPIGDDYGSYAALPSIGRTGRVTCVFGVGLDSFGQQSTGAVEVSIATYTSAAQAAGRAADTVQSDAQAGATTVSVSVGGHPATVVVEQTAVDASTAPATPSPGATGTASGAATAPATATASTASSAASPATPTGETELVMADGNRTFVLQVPFTKLSAQQAVTALAQLALEAYQNTLPVTPSAGADAPASPSRG